MTPPAEYIAAAIIVAAVVYWRFRRPRNPLADIQPLDRYRRARDDNGREY